MDPALSSAEVIDDDEASGGHEDTTAGAPPPPVLLSAHSDFVEVASPTSTEWEVWSSMEVPQSDLRGDKTDVRHYNDKFYRNELELCGIIAPESESFPKLPQMKGNVVAEMA